MKVLLNRCENDIECVRDCFGCVIGFKEDYQDKDGNIYQVYYKAILEGNDVEYAICNALWENVADWLKPNGVCYCLNDFSSTLAGIIAKRKASGKIMRSGTNILDAGDTVTVVKQGKQIILDI